MNTYKKHRGGRVDPQIVYLCLNFALNQPQPSLQPPLAGPSNSQKKTPCQRPSTSLPPPHGRFDWLPQARLHMRVRVALAVAIRPRRRDSAGPARFDVARNIRIRASLMYRRRRMRHIQIECSGHTDERPPFALSRHIVRQSCAQCRAADHSPSRRDVYMQHS